MFFKSRLAPPTAASEASRTEVKNMGKTNTNWSVANIFEERAADIDKKAHFRLKKYALTVKEIAKVGYGTHCKYNINYHFVWIPKTRMNILVEPFRTDIENNLYFI